MKDLSELDSVSERLSDEATYADKLVKYLKIVDIIEKEGIRLTKANPLTLVDESCEFTLIHNQITWDIFRVDDVAEMIIEARNNHRNKTT